VNFLAELRRRNVIRMAGLYLVGAWLVVQVAATLLPVFEAPGWVMRVLVALLAAGFVAALVFSWVYELTPEGLKRDADVSPAESVAPQTARRMDRTIIVVLLLALGYFAVDKFVLAPSGPEAAGDALPSAPAATPASGTTAVVPANPEAMPLDTKSIAVLAFANMSADKDNEYFSDGVAEEILNALAKIDDLKVAGRTSSFYFKGRNESLATIGSTLGVAHVLEGSVRKQGERLRISAKLLRVSDGVELWAETFDGTDADIFALQESIAQQVTGQLKVALNAGQQGRLVDVGTGDPDAYALYLRATDVFNRRDSQRYEEAIAALQQALQQDPRFARAHSRLATIYYVFASSLGAGRYAALVAQAREHAEQALRLNPELAEPHAVLGVLHQGARRYAEAHKAYERALQLDAADITANFWSALLQCTTGHTARCERGLEKTLEIDPLLPNGLNWRARLLLSAGDLEAAERTMARARGAGLQALWFTGSWIALKRGDLAGARTQALDMVRVLGGGLPPGAGELIADARVGDADARKRVLPMIDDYLVDPPAQISVLIPWTLVVNGEVDRGLATFANHATTNDAIFLGDFMATRLVPEVYASPAFPGFLRKTGIAAYWDEFGAPEQCHKAADGDYRCE
jgi:TolB-like protein/Tfp pilus assembly protein PilF